MRYLALSAGLQLGLDGRTTLTSKLLRIKRVRCISDAPTQFGVFS